MPALRSLDISDNAIMDAGIRSIIPYFIWAVQKPYPLLDIKLNNCNLSCSGVADLLRSLSTLMEPLNTFSVAENDLGSVVAAPLAKFLTSSGVRKLNIEDVGLGTLGFQQLEDQIPKEMVLQCINISKNRGGIRAAYFISKLLMCAPNIAYIHAGGNIMPPESAEVIHDALIESQGKLEVLDLTGNIKLCQSDYTARLLEFEHRGQPFVIIPRPSSSSTPYDDDP
ncbi:protein NLRC3 isoform X4 [Canna indica]|uniref:Protein NLRC3 isoform X4 n=1 Tax=Canna indica TaxID=4628 RepID=A0AAQ3KF84_9LILI|nr:protein NLRC3 isoform X4 [Canna indica]